MSSKQLHFVCNCFLCPFVKQLAGIIEENLDLGPTTDRQVLKSTFLYKSPPKFPTLVGPRFDAIKLRQNISLFM